MGDANLMVRLAAGDRLGVTELYRAYGRLVYTVAHRVLGDANLAQLATRQTFLQAHRLANDFDTSQELAPWLATIAGRTAIDVRSQTQRRTSPARPADTEPDVVPPTTEQLHQVWVFRHALDALPGQDRELIRLQHQLKLTPTEIAERLAIPLGEVTTRCRQAHRQLAGLLRQQRPANQAGTITAPGLCRSGGSPAGSAPH